MKNLSVIIINYNTPELTEQAIATLLATAGERVREVIAIDNGSSAPLEPGRLADPRLRLVMNANNLGFARAANQGLKLASGELLLLLNSDVLARPRAIEALAGYLEAHPHAGAVGPRMVYPDGRFQVSAGYALTPWSELLRLSGLYRHLPGSSFAYPNRWSRRLFSQGGPVAWVSGGCLLIRRQALEQVGDLDEHFFFGVEDIDFCQRLRAAGLEVAYLPQAVVEHHHGASSGGRRTLKKLRWERDNLDYFLKKHWPDKAASRKAIRLMHGAKILLLRYWN